MKLRALLPLPLLLVLLPGRAEAQGCDVHAIDGGNLIHPGAPSTSIGQSFVACDDGSVTTIRFSESGFVAGPSYEVWIAPEAGGDNTLYTVLPVWDTIADPGGAFPRVTTLALHEPYPVVAGLAYRFVLRRPGTILPTLVTHLNPAGDYLGGALSDDFGVVSFFDLDFQVEIRPANRYCPAELPTDPTIVDVGGDPELGPGVNVPTEPFNIRIDCTGASSNHIYQVLVSLSKLVHPPITSYGVLYIGRPFLAKQAGPHTRSVETLYPVPTGAPLPNDPGLRGLSFTVQGYCGGFQPNGAGRTTNAIVQPIW